MQSTLHTALRLSACLLTLALAADSLSAATGSSLEWRRGSAATKHESSVGSTSLRTKRETPVAAARSKELNPLRSTQPQVDAAVRTVAFEDDGGPQFENSARSESQFRSVIVEREDSVDGFRAAQLSSPGAEAGSAPGAAGETDTTGRPSGVQNPGVDTSSELPPLEEPSLEDFEPTPLPTEDRTQVQPQPREPVQPPARQPSTEAQPRVPRVNPNTGIGPAAEIPPAPPLNEETIQNERTKSEAACEQGFADLREKTIDKLSLSIAVTGEEGSDFPFECTIDEGAWHGGRCWEQTTYMWKASALCHKPLYFEDEQLERYGHSFSPCFQPFVSGAHFFTRLPVLPYCMGVEPPCECVYALGHYRPGNCAPYMCNPIPLSPRGAVFQAGAVVGTAAALP